MPIRTDRALKHPKLTKNEPTTREKAASEFNTHPTGVNETAEKVRKNETPMSRASALQAVNFYSLKANDIAEFPITNTRRRDIVPTFCAECSLGESMPYGRKNEAGMIVSGDRESARIVANFWV